MTPRDEYDDAEPHLASAPASFALDDIDSSPSVEFERGDHVEVSGRLLSALRVRGPITFDAGEFWQYAPRGVWSCLEAASVRTAAMRFAGCSVGLKSKPLKMSGPDTRGIESVARDRLTSDPARVTFAGAPPGVAFSNGFVTVRDGVVALLGHAPEHRARHGFDFDYATHAPEATPLFTAFLDQLFADCGEDERSARVALIQEFAGACLIGDATRYQKCLLLYGSGGNGKSALLTLLRAMFPREALCSLPPQRWNDRFSLESLENKRANFVSETPTSEILDGAAFKAVITGDVVTAERKQRPVFEFVPVAGHIFSLNVPLNTSDHSDGFWRRPIVLPLTHNFENDPYRVLNVEQDIIRAELAGVVAWAIEGAARAQRQGAYTMPTQSLAVANEWRDASDQVRLFLATRPDADEVLAGDFYKQYKSWALDNGHKNAVTSTTFGRRVKATNLYRTKHTSAGCLYTSTVKRAEQAQEEVNAHGH